MAADVYPSPPTTQLLRYVKATWDFDRDGGASGVITIPSQQVPAGSTIIGKSWKATTPVTSEGTPNISILLGPTVNLSGGNPAAVPNLTDFAGPFPSAPTDGSYPIQITSWGDPMTAGALTIYVWYI